MVTKIKTAVLLAAGKGERLKPYTNDKPKCLVEVGDKAILGHLLDALTQYQFEKLIVVTGYKSEIIREYLDSCNTSITIEYVHNEIFCSTNNIYSLWLADRLIDDQFILFESDLVFDPDFLNKIQQADKVVLDKFNPVIHDGTTAEVSEHGLLQNIHMELPSVANRNLYKTVNIYSFSFDTWKKIRDEIERYIGKGETNIYYETAIKKLVENDQISLTMADLTHYWWEEIDTVQDLQRAEQRFLITQSETVHHWNRNDL